MKSHAVAIVLGVLLASGVALAMPSKFEEWRRPFAPAPAPDGHHKHHEWRREEWRMDWPAAAPSPDFDRGHHEHKHEDGYGAHDDHRWDHHDDDYDRHHDYDRDHDYDHDSDHQNWHEREHEREREREHERDHDWHKRPVADLLFFVPASEASFPTNETLVLTGVTPGVAFNAEGGRAGVVPTGSFVNTTEGSRYVSRDGAWLRTPVAALFGNDGPYGNEALLVKLRDPVYEPTIQTLTFNVTVLPASEVVLTTSRGVTAELVSEAFYETRPVVSTVAPGTVWDNAGLFIDVNRWELHRDDSGWRAAEGPSADRRREEGRRHDGRDFWRAEGPSGELRREDRHRDGREWRGQAPTAELG